MPPDTPPANAGLEDGKERVRGRLMAQSLMQLLDRVRGSREVLPHLAALERGLLADGAAAIRQVPPHWLSRICSQLGSLPLPDDDPPLHDLLNRLMDEMEAHQGPPLRPDAFDAERTVVIREVSHSEFDAVSQEQATTQADELGDATDYRPR